MTITTGENTISEPLVILNEASKQPKEAETKEEKQVVPNAYDVVTTRPRHGHWRTKVLPF